MKILEDAKIRKLPTLTDRVDRLITENSHDVIEIRSLLDQLINSSYFGFGENEFEQLTEYYSTFNLKEANSYRYHLSTQTKERVYFEKKVEDRRAALVDCGWFWVD
jgi:hypothetical protein